LKTVIEAERSR